MVDRPRTPGLIDSRSPGLGRACARRSRRPRRDSMARGSKDKRKGRGSSMLGRALGLVAFMPIASRAPIYARLMVALLLDDRTPAARKALLAGAAGYLLVGRDLIPDDIPVFGGLDDLVVVVLAVDLFLHGVPAEL